MVSGRFTGSGQSSFQHVWWATAGRQAGRILCLMSSDSFLVSLCWKAFVFGDGAYLRIFFPLLFGCAIHLRATCF